MAFIYNGSHSIKIKIEGDSTVYDTWTDFHLIPASAPVVAPPAANISMIAVPGSSKVIDTTTLLSGGITYGLRQGSWEFIIDHERWSGGSDGCYQYLLSVLHGKKVSVWLSDSPGMQYTGRISVNDRKIDANYSTITLNYYFPYDGSSWDLETITLDEDRSIDFDVGNGKTVGFTAFRHSGEIDTTKWFVYMKDIVQSVPDSIAIRKFSDVTDETLISNNVRYDDSYYNLSYNSSTTYYTLQIKLHNINPDYPVQLSGNFYFVRVA